MLYMDRFRRFGRRPPAGNMPPKSSLALSFVGDPIVMRAMDCGSDRCTQPRSSTYMVEPCVSAVNKSCVGSAMKDRRFWTIVRIAKGSRPRKSGIVFTFWCLSASSSLIWSSTGSFVRSMLSSSSWFAFSRKE